MTYILENGEKLSQEYPDSFFIPFKEDRDNLKKGDIVKLIFLFDDKESMPERMWVMIVSKQDSHYVGLLDNVPYSTKSIRAGDEVIFKPENIIQIYKS